MRNIQPPGYSHSASQVSTIWRIYMSLIIIGPRWVVVWMIAYQRNKYQCTMDHELADAARLLCMRRADAACVLTRLHHFSG